MKGKIAKWEEFRAQYSLLYEWTYIHFQYFPIQFPRASSDDIYIFSDLNLIWQNRETCQYIVLKINFRSVRFSRTCLMDGGIILLTGTCSCLWCSQVFNLAPAEIGRFFYRTTSTGIFTWWRTGSTVCPHRRSPSKRCPCDPMTNISTLWDAA